MTPPTLEERVRRLEAFRYTMLGQMNAMRTILFGAWNLMLSGHADEIADDPVSYVRASREQWLNHPEVRQFPGADPAHLDAIWQEYEKAIDQLSGELLRVAEGLERIRKDRDGR